MLVIRMQRTGRKGHAQFRVVVQDSRRTPTSGKIVASLGSYNPHNQTAAIDKEKAGFYLDHGAQPSDRTVRLLKKEGIKLPAWVKLDADKQREVRNPDKRRSTRPAEPETEPAKAIAEAEAVEETIAEEAAEVVADEVEVAAEAAKTDAEPETPAAETAEAPAEPVEK